MIYGILDTIAYLILSLLGILYLVFGFLLLAEFIRVGNIFWEPLFLWGFGVLLIRFGFRIREKD